MIYKPTRRELLKYGVKAGILAFGVPTLLKFMERDAQAAVTYFGFGVNSNGTTHGTPTADAGYTTAFNFWLDPSQTGDASFGSPSSWLCPGSGSQDVVDISTYIETTSGGATYRLAVYDASTRALMAYGTNSTTISGGPSWQGYQSAGVITQVTALTGGSAYIVLLVLSTGGTTTIYKNSDSVVTLGFYNTSAYISSLPDPVPATGSPFYVMMVRIGVQAAAGGAAPVRHRVTQQ